MPRKSRATQAQWGILSLPPRTKRRGACRRACHSCRRRADNPKQWHHYLWHPAVDLAIPSFEFVRRTPGISCERPICSTLVCFIPLLDGPVALRVLALKLRLYAPLETGNSTHVLLRGPTCSLCVARARSLALK
jgi:hypothetical protein